MQSSTVRVVEGEGPLPGEQASEHVIGGKYRVGELLGKGGHGAVFRATQQGPRREVALKLLSPGADETARERFVREARIAAGMRHPCIAEVLDAGVTDAGTPYYVMELLEGETLAARLERGPLEPEVAVSLAAGLCSALQAVHAKGFLHRDVKPGNIFLAQRPDGGIDPKLIDFGIAKRLEVDQVALDRVTRRGLGPLKTVAPTAMNVIVGTPVYLSPEQILGEKVDARSDVYALSVTLYEALSGAPPFGGAEIVDLLATILTGKPAPIEGVPEALDRAVRRGLAKAPAERYPSAADLAAALWSALAETRHPTPVPARPARQRAGIAIAAALALGALLFVALRREPPRAAPAPAAAPAPIVTAAPTATASAEEPASAPATTATAAPEPRSRSARPRATASAIPTSAPTAAPAATPSSLKIDDLKVPF